MSRIVLSDIEQSILQLPDNEQLLLISRVAEKLRRRNIESESEFENQLAEMANDSEIKRELNQIETDFSETEFDGLDN